MKNKKISLEFTAEDWEIIRHLIFKSHDDKDFQWHDFFHKYTKEYKDKLYSELINLANIHNTIEKATRNFREEKMRDEKLNKK